MPEKDRNNSSAQANLTARVCVIRDGTRGISLSLGDEVIGEWTDSRVRTLSITDELKIAIRGEDGEPLYLFSLPGTPLSGEQTSDTEVTIAFAPRVS